MRLKISKLDTTLIVLALIFGAVSLFYPFGRDQGLYYYVGREWALRGAVPYRDVFDHKTPGLYIVHAGLVLLFGAKLWAIRVAELACVVWAGYVAGSLSVPAGQPLPRGVRGFAILVTSVFYYAFFDFRETGEGELWLATMGLAAALVLRNWKDDRAANLVAGALCGGAMLMKPSAIWFVLLNLVLAYRRTRKASTSWMALVRSGILFGAGAIAAIAPVFVYLAAKGALPAFYEIVVVANRHYVKHEAGIRSAWDLLFYHKWYFDWLHPFSPITVIGLVLVFALARKRGDRAMRGHYLFACALLVVSWLGVAMQAKYYLGHWGEMVPAAVMLFVSLTATLLRETESTWPRASTMGWAAVGFALLFTMTPSRFVRYAEITSTTVKFVAGAIPEEQYAALFVEHAAGARYADNLAVARWIRGRTTENDFIAVRGFQPQIYAFADRRYPGRFYWTSFMVSPSRAARGPEWQAEDRRALAAHPPKFVVTLSEIKENTDATEWWIPFGYTKRVTIGDFDVLERTPETAVASF